MDSNYASISRPPTILGLRLCAALVTVFVALAEEPAECRADEPASAEGVVLFEQQVRPILKEHCFRCHGGGAATKGGLRLNSRAALLEGGDSGPAISLEHPEESLLLAAVNYQDYEMPPSGMLPQRQREAITRWVQMGAPWTPGEEPVEQEPDLEDQAPRVDEQTKRFWSYQPVQRPSEPDVTRAEWVRTPIDAFVLSRLEQAGLAPSPPADKAALLRRAYYDLIGLPPSPEEFAEFLADDAPDAFARRIDQLLDSPHYGERWARHWLDLVRYAETNSYERDGAKPFVWRYRDYVIRAFNEDKPFDQFVLEQLAGDELDPPTPESIIATGFYRLGIWQDEPVDPEQALFDDLDDIVSTIGQTFLGMTIGCARCHDHKLDPIPQRDYYQLLAFVRNVRRFGVRAHKTVLDASVRTVATESERREHAELVREHSVRLRKVESDLAAIEKRIKKDLEGVEVDDFQTEEARREIVQRRVGRLITEDEFKRYTTLTKERERLRKQPPPGLAQALCVKEHGRTAPPTYVLVRGNAHAKGEKVQPGFPEVLTPPTPTITLPPPEANSTGRRLALARWIASAGNPLTARVLANRVWQHHFGRGIVSSPNDFGMQGSPPTHPELLDWLASELIAGGWRMKRIHRLIMNSALYQMSSRADERALALDPTNNLFWRFEMRRLSAEEIRDSILAVNGSLNRDAMYGPSIYPLLPKEVLAGQSRPGSGWGNSPPEERARRSIYIHVKRSLITPILSSFDAPDTDASCPVRFVTTQPTQALGMLNSQFIHREAAVFADYLTKAAGDNTSAQVELALSRSLQRKPTSGEIERGASLIKTLRERHQVSQTAALQLFCITALNLNEFIYLD